MLQLLLGERFDVVLHSVTKPTTGYALAVDRGGPKLQASSLEHSAGVTSAGGSASALSRDFGVPVVDQTHVDGVYALDIRFSKLGLTASCRRFSMR
jgi:uncharacterized protein (TIGR03435 family)